MTLNTTLRILKAQTFVILDFEDIFLVILNHVMCFMWDMYEGKHY